MTHKLMAVLALAAALLAGCGGGGGGGAESAGDRAVPEQALASADAFSRFVGSLRADDAAEPLDVGDVVPPRSESAEPIEVD